MLVQPSLPPWLRQVSDQTRQRLRESVRKALALRAPRTAEELWLLVAYRWGAGLARRAVCPEHDPPFEWLRRAFFQLDDRLFALAAKGTGKTYQFAIVHELNAQFKPGVWTAHVGAIEIQARRCFDYLEAHLRQEGLIGRAVDPLVWAAAIDGAPLRSKIVWRNGSRLEILAGTLGQVSGPHPTIGAMDEVELVDLEVWRHFAKSLHETPAARAQMLLGSTRFKLGGPVEQILSGAGEHGRPVWRVVRWCVWDAMSRCQYDCDNVPGFGRCPLWSRVEIGPDGTRQEVPMCAGRAHRADGHLTPDEVINAYLLSDHDSWATIMELRRPARRGAFFPEFDDTPGGLHVRPEYEWVPGQPVHLAYDDGFAYPAVLGAWQVTPSGLLYQFDEIYVVGKLPRQILAELEARPWFADVREGWGFADPTAHQAIAEFNDFCRARFGRALWRYDVDNTRLAGWQALRRRLWGARGRPTIGWHPRCVHTIRELKHLRRREGTEDCEKVDDHGPDMVRYFVLNFERLMGYNEARNAASRPDGGLERLAREAEARAEGLVRERWDRLRALGVPEAELRALEARWAGQRAALARALGGLLAELTLVGRLRRSGLAAEPEEDAELEEG